MYRQHVSSFKPFSWEALSTYLSRIHIQMKYNTMYRLGLYLGQYGIDHDQPCFFSVPRWSRNAQWTPPSVCKAIISRSKPRHMGPYEGLFHRYCCRNVSNLYCFWTHILEWGTWDLELRHTIYIHVSVASKLMTQMQTQVHTVLQQDGSLLSKN